MSYNIQTIVKPCGTKSLGVMRPKFNFMVTTMSAIYGEESSMLMMKSPPSQLWRMEMDDWCFGATMAQGIQSKLMGRRMQNSIRKYWRKICTHQPGSCALDALRLSNTTMVQKVDPSVASADQSEGCGAAVSLLTSVSSRHFWKIWNELFMWDNWRIYGTLRLFTKKNGQFYHLRT